MIAEWAKDCACAAPMSLPVLTSGYYGGKNTLTARVHLSPPICDGCGKPWRLVREGTGTK